MKAGEQYWSIVDPVWNVINIYDGEETFLETYSTVRREIGLLFAAHFCQSEVCNGGFEQFFWNDTGVLAPEAIEGFRAIGQVNVAAVIERACALLGAPYLRDREARQESLDRLDPESFDGLNTEFFVLIPTEAGGFEAAADTYSSRLLDGSHTT